MFSKTEIQFFSQKPANNTLSDGHFFLLNLNFEIVKYFARSSILFYKMSSTLENSFENIRIFTNF